MKKIFLYLVFALILSFSVSAANINVPNDYATIQAAINAASPGDTINVAAGTYVETVLISGKTNIIIQGVGDTTLVEPTPAYRAHGFAINNSNYITIKNLKIHTNAEESHGIWVYGAALGGSSMIGLTVQDTTIIADGGVSGIIGDSATNATHSGWLIGGVGHGNTIVAGGDGIDLQDVTDSEVSYNTITIPYLTGGTNVLWTSERFNLANLKFNNNAVSGSGGSEVSILTDFNQYVSNVPVEDPVVDTSIAGVTFSGNTFSNWGSRAIRVGNAAGTGTVTGITINSNTFQMTADTTQVIGGTATDKTGIGNTFNVNPGAKIQKAIDAAFTGDTINVGAGTYTENVNVNKQLILQGASSATVTVNAANSGNSVFTVTANNVNISGFTVNGATGGGQAGIYLGSGVTGSNIHDNILTGSFDGIWLGSGSNHNTLTDNTLSSNYQGFEVYISSDNTFTNNNASANNNYGFKIDSGNNNTFTNNIANSNTKYGFYVVVGDGGGATNSIFTNNIANLNTQYGIRINGGSDNMLTGNTFNSNVLAGLRLKDVITNLILDSNSISNSPIGIDIDVSVTDVTSWTLSKNKITSNTNGVSNLGTGTLNAENNWWGSNVGSTIATKISGTVDYTPWCSDSTCGASVADADGDGYLSNVDCNDNDNTKWQNLNGYVDTDNDGYGAGSSQQVCSGASLPSGYKTNAQDCNNNDTTVYPGATETCDNKDNNCDGTIDESLTQTYGTTDTGECSIGTKTCQAGAWVITTTAVEPATETCNNKDDDCDGTIDESLTQFYGTDTGECSIGTKTCQSGAWIITKQAVESTTEVCDNKDNNCDGTIDESLTKSYGTTDVGECQIGTMQCNSGIWRTTVNAIEPTTEIEDGIDNDCDGTVDEGFDKDSDGITDSFDNCQDVYNPSQANTYGDARGDACESQAVIEEKVEITKVEETITTEAEAEKTLTKVETNKEETGMELSLSTNEGQAGTIKVETFGDVPEAKSFTAEGLTTQKYVVITPDKNIEDDIKQAMIKIYYTHDDLGDIAEQDLRVYYFNGEDWVAESNSGVNTEENYVWAITNHLSLFTLGKKKAVQLTTYYLDEDGDGYGAAESKYLSAPEGDYTVTNSYDLEDNDPFVGINYYNELNTSKKHVWQNTDFDLIVCRSPGTFNTFADGNEACKERYGEEATLGKCNSKFAWINTGCDPNYWKTWKTSKPGIQGRLCECIVPEK